MKPSAELYYIKMAEGFIFLASVQNNGRRLILPRYVPGYDMISRVGKCAKYWQKTYFMI
uniref:Uncharacterized protein n=1 Tax=Rhizophagus irregularis (strain DAOM 181602 / DAOM 197198 / MUCL 43194) TaxID=747089 RepID=U9T7F8_RHIID